MYRLIVYVRNDELLEKRRRVASIVGSDEEIDRFLKEFEKTMKESGWKCRFTYKGYLCTKSDGSVKLVDLELEEIN